MSDSVDLNETEQEALEAAVNEIESQDNEAANDSNPLPEEHSPLALQQEGDRGMEAAEATPGWKQELQNAGFQSFDDADNAVKALIESNRQREQQVSTYADQLKFYQQQLYNSQNYQQSQQQPKAEPPQKRDPLTDLIDGWQDPSWANQYIEVDHEGNRVIADHVDDETREKILGIDRKLRQWQEVLQDPRQFAAAVDQRVDQMIADKFESSYQQKQTQAQENATIDNFINQNASWLYQRDPASGRYLTDPMNGEYIYSQNGKRFLDHMDAFAADGVSSVTKQLQYAQMAMGIVPGQTTQSHPQASASDSAQNRRTEMRGRTNTSRTRQSSFNGVTAESGGDQTGRHQMSFGEETLAAMMSGTE
jgi:hypothetical protein